jgi:imidazolonepropionase-like amidohydrolase
LSYSFALVCHYLPGVVIELSALKNAVLIGIFCMTATMRSAVPSAIAIKDAHVVTVSGEDMSKATVLLRDGLIEDVGPQVTIPADAWVIEGAGLTVYPGFVNALSNWGLLAAPAAGRGATATTPAAPRVHGPEDRPQNYSYERAADSLNPEDKKLEAARAAGFTSSATFPDEGIFRGLGAYINLAGDNGRAMVVAEPIGQEIALARSRGFSRTFPGSLMGYIAYVRQIYLDLGQYEQAKTLYAAHPVGQKRPEYDHTLEGLEESPRLLLPAVESQQIERMLHFGAELQKPFVLYGLHEGYKEVDELKQANVPVLISLKWPEKPKDADPDDVPDYRTLVMRDQAPAVPGMLAKAGVKFAFYSDGVDSAADLKKAVKRALDAGLSRPDAIRALTLTPAEIYGVADRTGSIAKGKIADLLVTKGDAFDDKTTVEYVFVDGVEFKPAKAQRDRTRADREVRLTPSVVSASLKPRPFCAYLDETPTKPGGGGRRPNVAMPAASEGTL